MATVDEKVVRLTMDDSQFDKASDRTISKLDELKKSLEFNGAVDSFDELEKAASKVDMSPLEKGAEYVSQKFSALEIIAIGALTRIGSQAVDTGERLLKSLTIDNISDGWNKYADKTAAVQTIMSATAKQFTDTGEQMAFVEDKLERLNWFTDETSYRFLDMVNNIGKFTNNSVELGTAVTAMQGISTWAASAGANVTEAGRAMYNLSQAIAVGSVKLIDWKSIENANMATAEFKQMAIETAEELGTLKKIGEDTWETLAGHTVTVETFNENLSYDKWFSSDVLLKVLDRYGGFADRLADVVDETGVLTTTLLNYIDEYIDGTIDMAEAIDDTGLSAEELTALLEELSDDQYELGRKAFKAAQETKTFAEAIDYVKEAVSSSWMQSFEYIFGNYTEAKALWSDLSEALYEVFVESGNVRNELLKLWKENGGRDRFIDAVKLALSNIMKLVDAVGEGFRRIFPEATVDTLIEFTRRFELLVETLTPTEKQLENISTIVQFLVNVIAKAVSVFAAVVAGLDPILNLIVGIFNMLLDLAGFAAGEGNGILDRIFGSENLFKVYEIVYNISTVIANIVKLLMLIGAGIFAEIIQFAQNVYNTFMQGEGGITGFFKALIVNIQAAVENFTNGENVMGKVVKSIIDMAKELANGFMEAFEGGESKGLGGFIGRLASSIKDSGIFNVLETLIGMVSTAIMWLASGISGLLDGSKSLSEVVAFIADQLNFLWDWLKASISNLTVQDIAIIALVLSIVSLVNTAKKGITAITTTISGLSGVLTKLQTTIASFAQGSWITDFTNSLNTLSKNTKWAQIALAIYVAVEGIMKLAEVPIGDLTYAVSALAVVVGLIILAVKVLEKLAAALGNSDSGSANSDRNSKAYALKSVAATIQAMGIAIGAIGVAVKIFADVLDKEDGIKKLIASVGVVIILLANLVAVAAAFDKFKIDTKKFAKIGASFLIFAGAIDMLAVAVALLSQFNIAAVAVSGGVVVALVAAMSLLAAATQKADWKSILTAGATIISLSGALIVMSGAIAILSAAATAFPGGIATAIVDLVGMIVLLTGALALFGGVSSKANPVTLLAMSAAMITFAGAITILSAALYLLIPIPWDTMAKGAAVLVAALAAFAVVAGLASVFAVGLGAIGIALLGLAAAFIAFGAAIGIIADAIVKMGAFAIALMAAGEVIGDDLPAKITKAFETIQVFISKFLEVIRNLAPEFAATFGALAAGALEAIMLIFASKYPAFLQAILAMAMGVLELLARLGGPLVDALTRAIQGLTEGLPQLLEAIGVFIEELFDGIGVILNHAVKGLLRGLFSFLGVNFTQSSKELGESVTKDVKSILEDAGYVVREDGTILKEVEGKLVEVEVIIDRKTGEITDTLSSGLVNAADKSIDDFNATIDSKMDVTEEQAKALGAIAGAGVIGGYRETTGWGSPWSTILDSIDDMLSSFQIGAGNISDGVQNAGASIGFDFANGIIGTSENQISQYLNSDSTFLASLLGFAKLDNAIIDDFAGYTHSNLGMNPGSSAGAAQVRAAIEQEAADAGTDAGETWINTFMDSVTTGLSGGSGSGASVAAAAKEEIKEESEIIKEAYEEGLAEIELAAKKSDLQNNLWDAINRDASEAELVAKNIAYTTKKIAYQEKRLNLALKQHQDLVLAYGEESVEAQNAYFTVLEAQTDLVNLQNDLVDLQNTYISNEQDLLDKMELVRNQRDLEYQLWEAQNPNASDAEKQLMERQQLSYQLEDATEDMILAQDNYNKAVERYGEGSNEAMQAWAVYLKAVIEQTKLQNELTGAAQQSSEDLAENYKNAAAWMRDNTDTLNFLREEFGEDRVQQYIRDTFGLQPLQQAEEELEEAAEQSAEDVYNKYGMTMQAGLAALEPAFEQQGATYTTNMTDGMTSEMSINGIMDATNEVVQTSLDTANSDKHKQSWIETGEYIILGTIEGVKNKEGELYAYLEYVIETALARMRAAAAIKSPSRETMWMGEMLDKGLEVGLIKYTPDVLGAAAGLMNNVLDTMTDTNTTSNLEFAGRLVAGGIAGGINDYSYQVIEASEGLIERMNKAIEEELPTADEEMAKLLESYGYDINDLDYDFVINLDMDKAYEDMTEFERALNDIGSLKSAMYQYRPMDYDTWESFFGYESRGGVFFKKNQEKLEAEYAAYSANLAQEHAKAYEAWAEARSMILGSLAAAAKSDNSFADAVEDTRAQKVINYTQNIYSEKPLSSLDVYRNTNNALQRLS